MSLVQPFKLASVVTFFLTAILLGYSFVILVRNYLKKRKSIILSLMVLLGGCMVINIFSGLDSLFYNEPGGYGSRYGYALSLVFTGIATVGLLYFATEVFTKEGVTKPIQYGRLVFSICMLIISIIGTASLLLGEVVQTSLPLILMFMLNLTLYIVLAIRSYALANRIEDPKYKKSIKYIGHFAVGNLFLFPSFILDSLIATPPDIPVGTTYWTFIGTLVFIFLAYLAYVGFVKPMTAE